jgi:glutamate-1-semialdehyde 2,1-aminomutase
MKVIKTLNPSDLQLVQDRLADFIPSEVMDIHAHIFRSDQFGPDDYKWLASEKMLTCADHRAALGRYLPGRTLHGLYIGMPAKGANREATNQWVRDEVRANGSPLSRCLVLAAPNDSPEKVHDLLKQPGVAGVKVYHFFLPGKDTFQASVAEFAPEWMWDVCHATRSVLTIHLVRDLSIADPENLKTIQTFSRRYPNCQVVLAHAARCFNHRLAPRAMSQLVDRDNVWIDTAAINEAEPLREAIRQLGVHRVLYGSDYAISEARGRCVTTGDSFFWIYDDIIKPEYAPPTVMRMTLIGIETLLYLREVADECGLSETDLKAIFFGNSLRLLGSHLEHGNVTAATAPAELWSEAKKRISCGTGLMSKRAESFDPATWPTYFSKCLGCEVWDMQGQRYTDFAGGVGAIMLGYADPDVTRAVRRRLNVGTYCTLVSPDEVVLADLLIELHPWAARVRYARGGGEAMAVAVRIVRAATGRSGIAFCGYHGWQDWYLAANLGDQSSLDGHLLPGLQPLGVPRELLGTAVPFKYNDWAAFESAMQRLDGKLAAVVMEPMRSQWPKDDFLNRVAQRCRAAGGLFVVDEITSGWRFGFPGALAKLGVQPDLAVYAKAMSNGFPCAAVIGKAEPMDAANPSFISSSYWTEGVGTTASLACIRKMREQKSQEYVWKLGEHLQGRLNELAAKHPSVRLKVGGMPCAPSLAFDLGASAAAAKTLMIRKMLPRGFLMSSQLYVMQAHTRAKVDAMLPHLDEVLEELDVLQDSQKLAAEAGAQVTRGGFARLA